MWSSSVPFVPCVAAFAVEITASVFLLQHLNFYLIPSQCDITRSLTFPDFPLRCCYFTSAHQSVYSDWLRDNLVLLSVFIIQPVDSSVPRKWVPGRRSLVWRPHLSKQRPTSFIVPYNCVCFFVFDSVILVFILVSLPWLSCLEHVVRLIDSCMEISSLYLYN